MMVVNTKCGWTADPRLHTITDLKSESAYGSGLKIRFSAHRINDRRQSLLVPTAPSTHSEDVHSPKRAHRTPVCVYRFGQFENRMCDKRNRKRTFNSIIEYSIIV